MRMMGNRECIRYLRYVACTVESGDETWLNVSPGALVLGFFLRPDEFGVRVLGHFLLNKIVRERRNLKREQNQIMRNSDITDLR